MSTQIKVPDIGDFDAVEVIEVLVAEGDDIQAEQSLLVLESDKATMEVPCPASGRLTSFTVKVGDKIAQGDVIGELEIAEQDAAPAVAEQKKPTVSEEPSIEAPTAAAEESKVKAAAPPPPPPPVVSTDKSSLPHASPSIRLLARELGVDLLQVSGSGSKGRILKEDLQQFVKTALQSTSPVGVGTTALPSMPAVDFSKFGDIESKELPRIRKLSAANLHRNWVVVPHVTQFESADITELEAFRKAESVPGGTKLTLLPFVIKTIALALKNQPEFNSSLSPDGASLIMKGYCNIGFAADTPQGLVVPVIRDVWQKTVSELAVEAGELAAKARDGKLSPADMQGGCFSISSLGGIGGSHFTPIVNAPEVAILGVSRAKTEAVWDGQAFQPRTMLPLSLSYDHRVIDGAAAARFSVYVAQLLSDIRRLCL
ncbi:MAG: dihydrolipoyllysine-residue acetyltransferase [Oceanococcus sp.]